VSAEAPPLAVTAVGSGFVDPIGVVGAPGGWLLVNERPGRIVALDPATGMTKVALDITDRVLGGGERGLLGLVLAAGWPDDARAFVHYTDRDGNTVLSVFDAAADADGVPIIDAGSEAIVLRQVQPFANHNGGQLAFGPDGYLWMALGDGGSGGDPQGNGQNPNALLGKLLRLDVSGTAGYAIPPDNPFADGELGSPEVALYGLRNPWRFSFDRLTGLLWIGDVGQNAFEEIDRVDPVAELGANLGWNRMEGAHCFNAAECDQSGLTLPVVEYGRALGCATIGGFVYRGDAIPGLRGWYLFSDSCSGLLFGIPSDATGVNDPRTLLETGVGISSFGEGADGELYLAGLGSGTIYRIDAGR
jgi:glucose/arabinose dehydrogenase